MKSQDAFYLPTSPKPVHYKSGMKKPRLKGNSEENPDGLKQFKLDKPVIFGPN